MSYTFKKDKAPLLNCPSSKAVYLSDQQLNYVVNYQITQAADQGAIPEKAGVKRTKIAKSSDITMVADGKVYDGGETHYVFMHPNSGNGAHHPGFDIHTKRANILWVDGHVNAVQYGGIENSQVYPIW